MEDFTKTRPKQVKNGQNWLKDRALPEALACIQLIKLCKAFGVFKVSVKYIPEIQDVIDKKTKLLETDRWTWVHTSPKNALNLMVSPSCMNHVDCQTDRDRQTRRMDG